MSEPLADVREMYMSHIMYRRELGLAPALIRGVASGDVERAATVAGHLELVLTVLEHHHHGEDEHLWPRLTDRAGAAAEPVVQVMEEQHQGLDRLMTEVRTGLARLRATAAPVERTALAETAAQLSARLDEHLAVEEEHALPLVEKHITAAEWGRMVAEAAVGIPEEQLPLIFGLMAYEGDPDTVSDAIATMPPDIRPVIGERAAQAFAEHAQLVYGTATPPRIGAPDGAPARPSATDVRLGAP